MDSQNDRLNTALADRYRIERELGAGGMATVYLAHDVRHDRKVALKVLRPELSAILGAARFLTEIKTTANLQHPHILSLFDSGEADGTVFYVMPYVEGESLRDRLKREHQLPVEDAVRIAREVLDALEYAHQHGIVHRDIKPENILLHGGHAMVADFGIALAASKVEGGTRMTETGMSLGTPHYMSPEQAMGEREITPKADIYALGCVLYEMLTGEPPFTGHSAQAIFARVLTDEPRSLTVQRKTIPPYIESAVHLSLQKLPADRFTSAAQFAEALGSAGSAQVLSATKAGTAAAAQRRQPAQIAIFASVAVAAGLLGAGLLKVLSPAAETRAKPVVRFGIAMPRDAQPVGALGSTIAFSPDGSRIVYVGKAPNGQRLYSRGLDQLEPAAIPGSDGASLPFFSADGRFVGFRQRGQLVKVSLAGGPVLPICDVKGGAYGATWTKGDTIIFATDSGLMSVPAAGGTPSRIAKPDSGEAFFWPDVLPNGRAILITVFARGRATLGAFIRKSSVVKRFDQGGGYPRYVAAGFVVLSDPSGIVSSVPFDADRLEVTGAAAPLADKISTAAIGDRNMGVSNDGDVAFQGSISAGSRLVLVDRSGAVRQAAPDTGLYWSPRFAPNGRRVALMRFKDQNFTSVDVWIVDLAHPTQTRLTFDTTAGFPVWTPDGRRVAYSRAKGAATEFALVPADGGGSPEVIINEAGNSWLPVAFEPGGRGLLYQGQPSSQSGGEIRRATVGDKKPGTAVIEGAFVKANPSLSPDGRWMTYQSNETGRFEVYVRSNTGTGGRWQVSLKGGSEPVWSPAGNEIFYRDGDAMMAAAVTTRGAVEIGSRVRLFEGAFETTPPGLTNYDVSRDGKTFLMLQPVTGEAQSVHVLLNWFAQPRSPR